MAGSDFALQHAAAPARSHFTVTFSDSVNTPFRSLWCNAAGNVAVVDLDDVVFVYTVPAGTELRVQGKRVNTTLTTVAASSVAGWR